MANIKNPGSDPLQSMSMREFLWPQGLSGVSFGTPSEPGYYMYDVFIEEILQINWMLTLQRQP